MTQPQTLLAERLHTQQLSQSALARKLRVSRQTIHHWVHAKEPVPRARRAQLAVTLGISVADYFREDGYAR